MKSVRLDEALEMRLQEAARIANLPVSAFIRQAIEQHCERVLGQRLSERLADVSGVVCSRGGNARHSGKAFTAQLESRQKTAS